MVQETGFLAPEVSILCPQTPPMIGGRTGWATVMVAEPVAAPRTGSEAELRGYSNALTYVFHMSSTGSL